MSFVFWMTNANSNSSTQQSSPSCYTTIASSAVYGLYTLHRIVQNHPASSFESGFSSLPAVSIKLGKGSLDELILSKTLCGTIIYGTRYIVQALELSGLPSAKELIYLASLAPSIYQHNEAFHYDKASLPTVLTLFTTKTSAKLLEQNLRDYGLSSSESGAVILSAALILWMVSTAHETGNPGLVFFWVALPKFYVSSALSQFYKASRADQKYGSLYSGMLWYQIGSLIYSGLKLDVLPKLSGLTESFAGKSQKLLGYGVADSIKQAVDQSALPSELKNTASYFSIQLLTTTVNSLFLQYPSSYRLKALRRGLIVRLALLKVELALQGGAILEKLILEPMMGESIEITQVTDELLQSDTDENCVLVPVNGMATSLYHKHCFIPLKTGFSQPMIDISELEWITFLFIL